MQEAGLGPAWLAEVLTAESARGSRVLALSSHELLGATPRRYCSQFSSRRAGLPLDRPTALPPSRPRGWPLASRGAREPHGRGRRWASQLDMVHTRALMRRNRSSAAVGSLRQPSMTGDTITRDRDSKPRRARRSTSQAVAAEELRSEAAGKRMSSWVSPGGTGITVIGESERRGRGRLAAPVDARARSARMRARHRHRHTSIVEHDARRQREPLAGPRPRSTPDQPRMSSGVYRLERLDIHLLSRYSLIDVAGSPPSRRVVSASTVGARKHRFRAGLHLHLPAVAVHRCAPSSRGGWSHQLAMVDARTAGSSSPAGTSWRTRAIANRRSATLRGPWSRRWVTRSRSCAFVVATELLGSRPSRRPSRHARERAVAAAEHPPRAAFRPARAGASRDRPI